ncbi:MAG: DUF3822 family protein [Bacteroidetes bacterium]|nr:DUF3822 family protein [Bacteroidota bacterium]
MATDSLSFNPSCQPDTWILLIGPDRFASAAIDPFNRYVLQAECSTLDLYSPDFFRQQAKAIFTDRAEIRKIRVCFLLPEWFWTPTSLDAEIPETLGPTTGFPEKAGHDWITDTNPSADATAWVRVPQHILRQLHELTPTLEYKHTAVFFARPKTKSSAHLQILRIGGVCWFSLFEGDRFLYGQPHPVTTAEDLLYVVSLLADTYKFQTGKLELTLTGEWSLDSEWLIPLRQRFAWLTTRESTWKNLSSDRPAHWFTPLEDVFSCA